MKRFKDNGKLKLLIIVGTRPEIIRLAAVINKCREYFDCLLAHTGQNYDYNLNGVFFKDLKLADPDIYMEAVGNDLGETMGNIIAASYKLMVEIKPDAVLVLGDTNSCLSVIGAKRLHIPIFHMEAGNRCKDENLPEEELKGVMRWRWLLDYVAAWQTLILNRKWGDFKAIYKARRDFKRWLPEFKEVREQIQKGRKVGADDGRKRYSLLWQYYVRGRKHFSELP